MKGFLNKKYAASIVLCFLVALNKPASIEAGYTMNETCAYIAKGYIGDPTNCQNYGYCSGGYLIGTGSCKDGFLFDSKTSMCQYPSLVQCQTTLEDACALATEPGYIADPNNCNRYCYCANKVPQYFNCPQYQVFNPEVNQCVWGRNYACPANSICRLVANNVFAGDPAECGNYIRCQDGGGNSLPCGNSLLFNPMSGQCEPYYTCNSAPGNEPGDNGIPTQNPTICSENYKNTDTGIQYYSDGLSCYGFYSCQSATDIGIWGSCPFATHFNPSLQKCVTPYTYKCPYDRCGNLNLKFVAQIGCAGYSVCTNQKTTSTGICADETQGYNWFNEYGGGCVQNQPTNQPICV